MDVSDQPSQYAIVLPNWILVASTISRRPTLYAEKELQLQKCFEPRSHKLYKDHAVKQISQ